MLRIVFCIVALALTQPSLAETVRSLDQVPGQLKTPEAKKFFREQMEGKPAPDLLGTHLPPMLPASTVAALLVPADDHGKVHLVGAKPWPVSPDLYVAIVCTGGEEPFSSGEPRCARSGAANSAPLHVYLGLIAARKETAPTVLAASGPVDCAMDWRDSSLPRQPMAADDAKDGIIPPDSFESFDLAHFRIAPDQLAFGVRGGWMEGYSGGGANFTGLCLFTRDGQRLKQVLAVPMSAYSDIAGDWHKNGTRDHDITDAANVLIVSPRRTDEHFDLIVKDGAGPERQVFRWSKATGAYRPAGK